MEIPDALVAEIENGNVALVLGAGASRAATDDKGNQPPNGTELGEKLAKRFLGGKFSDAPLSQIAEYSTSETDLATVQTFIADLLEKFSPSNAHRRMANFVWRGIATTNYDRLIERGYAENDRAVQVPIPFIENGDRVDERMRDPRSVMLLKLHGCTTRVTNSACPFILTTDQYVDHRRNRDRLFEHLRDWAFERPLVFIGHSLQDSDLRALLLELTQLGEHRPRYYTVTPEVDEIQRRAWEQKKITPLKGTFAEFIDALEAKITSPFKSLAVLKRITDHPIVSRFKVAHSALSKAAKQFLENDVDLVASIAKTEVIAPSRFYRGFDSGFSATEQQLDVRRQICDTILADRVLIDESAHAPTMELILVRAHAGAGKTVALKRIAWDAAHDYDCLCLYLRPHGVLNTAAIQEIISLCQERVYLFVDDSADHTRELRNLARNIGSEGASLTVITAERMNEWNIYCDELAPYVSDWYELGYLSTKEIDQLLKLLETNHALGTLEKKSLQERRAAFQELAGRQLLVALHEATLGKPFEEILENEYNNVQPPEAQRMYLTICALDRLNVPVRAGLVARIHGIKFEEFQERLFKPLEYVVQTSFDPILRDYSYRARHPHIASIVFERILRNAEERFDVYMRCLRELNVDYSADRRAFWLMIKGRTLLDLFPDHTAVKTIFDLATRKLGRDPYLLHQMAIYELQRPNGSVIEASNLLSAALEAAPDDVTIKHSMAELRLRRAELARTPLEAEKALAEAAAIASSIKSVEAAQSYPYHTLAKISFKKIQGALEAAADEKTIQDLLKQFATNVAEGLQRFPEDSYLLEMDARVATLLSDDSRVLNSLTKACEANPRNAFLALRLADIYRRKGDIESAKSAVRKALDANRGERRLNFAYGKLLLESGVATGDELAYYFQRSFYEGDSNHDAQLLYGRQLFINGDKEASRRVFSKLGIAHLSPEERNRIRYPIDGVFNGSITRLEASYCFVARDGTNEWIYSHRSAIDDSVWKSLDVGQRVRFRIAFTFRGACATHVTLEAQHAGNLFERAEVFCIK